MKSLVYPIRINEVSFKVERLHKALAVLGYSVSESERAKRTAGEDTQQKVRELKAVLKVQDSGESLIDEQSANAIYKELKSRGVLPNECIFKVSGRVIFTSGHRAKKQQILAVDVDLRGAAIVRSVQSVGDLIKNGGIEQLDEFLCDSNGYYEFTFDCNQFGRAERKKADVVVFAIEDDRIVGRSKMVSADAYSDTGEARNVDVIISRDLNAETEYKRVMGMLTEFLKESEVSLRELSLSPEQIVFTASELDIDESIVRIVINADALSGENRKPLSHELLYGIGRQRIALAWQALYNKSESELRLAIDNSTKGNIISAHKQEEIDAFLVLLLEQSADYILTHKATDNAMPLEKTLSFALPVAEHRISFVRAVKAYTGEPAAFWKEYLPTQPGFDKPELIESLLLTHQLTLLTVNHPPLLEELMVSRKIKSATELFDLKDSDWDEMLRRTGVPIGIPGDSQEEKVQNYAGMMQDVLYAAYPTKKIAAMVKKGDLPVADQADLGLQNFLEKNEAFDFGKSRIDDFENAIRETDPENKNGLKKELKKFQRVFQVSPTPAAMQVLIKHGLDSAQSINSIPKKTFLTNYSAELGGESVANAVYERANYTSTRAEHQAMKLMELTHGLSPAYTMDKLEFQEMTSVLKKVIPNYTELFGSPDICECDHCRSVFSPAAYFVDLLRSLWRGGPNSNDKSVLDMLKKRRPDLLHLPLTCENTNTIIPYIDLVNEVMEYYTAEGELDKDAAYDTGSTTAAELRANPQNFNVKAYRTLSQSVYPFTLPYHQPLDVIRTYSDHLKYERSRIMMDLQTDFSIPAQRAIDAEVLRLSAKEYAIITQKSFDDADDTEQLYAYFGYNNLGQLEQIASAQEFVKRSGVFYKDLVELTKTEFINPGQKTLDFLQNLFAGSALSPVMVYSKLRQVHSGSLIPSDDAALITVLNRYGIRSASFAGWVIDNFEDFQTVLTLYQEQSLCDLDTTYLRTVKNIYEGVNESGISEEVFSKIHRFIRLWRKLGWTIHEVDLMLTVLGQADIAPDTIEKLSAVAQILKEVKIPVNQLATMWGSIDTYGEKSLYRKLFLNRAVQTIDRAFQPDAWGKLLADETLLLHDHQPAIMAAFSISEEDLTAILSVSHVIEGGNERELDFENDHLTLANLSIIYRHVSLAKALKTKVSDLVAFIYLFDLRPFSSWDMDNRMFSGVDPHRTLDLIRVVQAVKNTGFKVATLDYIFNGVLPLDSKLGLDNAKVLGSAHAIRQSFFTIESDHPLSPGNALSIDALRSKLSLTFQADSANLFTSMLDGTVQYNTVTDTNLDIVIPTALSVRFRYVKASGRITLTGVMSESDRSTLKALANVTPQFAAAIDELYVLAEMFIRENFGSVFVNLPEAFAVLLDRPAQPVAATIDDKIAFAYTRYVPLLQQQLRRTSIIQHTAALTGLSENQTTVLISDDLDSLSDNIWQAGASAAYFNDINWTTPVLERIEKKLNFNWGAGSPDPLVPVDNFSAIWTTYIAPPSSGEYTLVVDVLEADEAFRLYVDEELLLEKNAGDVNTSWEAIVLLNAGQLRKLSLAYAEQAQAAGIQLRWKTALTALSHIPTEICYPAELIDAFLAAITTYHRAAKFITGFTLTEAELSHLIRYKQHFGDIDFEMLSAEDWIRVKDYVVLRNSVPQSQALLIDVFKEASETLPSVPSIETIIKIVQLATNWDYQTLSYLVKNHFAMNVADFQNEMALVRLRKGIAMTARTGTPAKALARWARPDTDFDALNDTAQLVKNTVKAKYEEEDWFKLAGELSDKTREHQKEALISYLLMRPELQAWGVTDADSLFEYFLIDVQMGACMDTSRIVQANASVQMFVSRCLLNLESDSASGNETGVSPSYIDTTRWEWMKNYRVWEANRKVFLYAENWLEPEWRDDRSPFFKDLESELIQNDISERSVESAFRNYLQKVNEIANLEVVGSYQENDADGNLYLFHVVARTHNAPYQFYYRTWNKYMKWTSWEKIPVDIRCVDEPAYHGIHPIPVVWKKRLFIFWPEFIRQKEQTEGNNGKTAETLAGQNVSTLQPNEYWEVRLGWTENVEGKWTPKVVSKEFAVSYVATVQTLSFRTEVNVNQELSITMFNSFDWSVHAYFLLPDIQSKVSIIYPWVYYYTPSTASNVYKSDFMKRSKNAPLELKGNTYLQQSVDHRLLHSNAAINFEGTVNKPFFYSDAFRTYFVRPITVNVPGVIRHPELLEPFIPHFVDDSYFTQPHIPEIDDYRPGEIFEENLFASGQPSGWNEQGSVVFNNMATLQPQLNPAISKGIANDMAVPRLNVAGKGQAGVMTERSNVTVPFVEANALVSEAHSFAKAFGGVRAVDSINWGFNWQKAPGMEFHTFYHPNSSRFVTRLNQYGLTGMLHSDTSIYGDGGNKFRTAYRPNTRYTPQPSDFAKRTYYKENVCFDVYGANSIYNWELFFHAPLYIASRLSKNGKYAEAMQWFHHIFDPTTDAIAMPGESATARYWKVPPFKVTVAEDLQQWFMDLAENDNPSVENMVIGEWRDNPFNPHVIARNRPLAYMKNVVIKYVDNLLAWGDSLFRLDTMESVNEALQLYVMANHILGPRPQFIPKRGEVSAETYASLDEKWDDFSNAMVEFENIFPYSGELPRSTDSNTGSLLGFGSSLYFCIPGNEKLMESWDIAADRLYKIRHCMNIDGVERKLALFAPAIDPAALINAMSKGMSLGSILSDLSSPPPIYRFSYLIQRSNEFTSEVKSLGAALLSALEKKDAEALGRLRATHEISVLELMTGIRERQILDAKAAKDALVKSRELAAFRMNHYTALLGNETLVVPGMPTIAGEVNSETELPADTNIALVQANVDDVLVESGESGIKIINKEKEDLDKNLAAKWFMSGASLAEALAGVFSLFPQIDAEGTPLGVGVGAWWGGQNLGPATSALGNAAQAFGTFLTMEAAAASKVASYIRREQDWTLQVNLASREIVQLDKQIVGADIRVQIAVKELAHHKKQIDNAKEAELFLQNKFTNQELYQWLKDQLFDVYKQSYNMAYEMAKKTEKCYRFEIGEELTNFIQYGYWESSFQGLMAGERLQMALRQMEKSYLEQNKRELELIKHVSMAAWNPLALQELKETGKCYLRVSEELFDLDFQGHYFRRLKSVSISIPCITGPFTSIGCTLRLMKNSIRTNSTMGADGNYERNGEEGVLLDDDRFRDSVVPVKTIATSSAQHDAGVFELNFRDERYLPFEGGGAISEWKIELTADEDLRQFDYSTIADLVMHISYTAREDAGLFKSKAVEYLKNYLTNAAEVSVQPLVRMFSLKHDFPTAWYKFLNPSAIGVDQQLTIELKKEHFPFFVKNRDLVPMRLNVLIRSANTGDYTMVLSGTDKSEELFSSTEINLAENSTYGGMQVCTLSGTTADINVEEVDLFTPVSLKLKNNGASDYSSLGKEELKDVLFVVHYKTDDL